MQPLRSLRLRHATGTTRVFLGAGALEEASSHLDEWLDGRAAFVLTSPTLKTFLDALRPKLSAAARVEILETEDGEAAKTIARATELWERMAELRGRRSSRLITLGGGTLGDLGGFVSGCYLRGIQYSQVPTTLLAQVDASIGGKTGIDLPQAKNSVGLFHHPRLVISELAFLEGLPNAEVRSGLFEIVKTAAMLDAALFEGLESALEELSDPPIETLSRLVAPTAAAKIRLVEQDPRESGPRRFLNFGHTLGHSIETALGYQTLRHGEAVGYGMLFALRLARSRGLADEDAARIEAVIAAIGLPPLPPVEVGALMDGIDQDKKNREHALVWALPKSVGVGRLVADLPMPEVQSELESFLADVATVTA